MGQRGGGGGEQWDREEGEEVSRGEGEEVSSGAERGRCIYRIP